VIFIVADCRAVERLPSSRHYRFFFACVLFPRALSFVVERAENCLLVNKSARAFLKVKPPPRVLFFFSFFFHKQIGKNTHATLCRGFKIKKILAASTCPTRAPFFKKSCIISSSTLRRRFHPSSIFSSQ